MLKTCFQQQSIYSVSNILFDIIMLFDIVTWCYWVYQNFIKLEHNFLEFSKLLKGTINLLSVLKTHWSSEAPSPGEGSSSLTSGEMKKNLHLLVVKDKANEISVVLPEHYNIYLFTVSDMASTQFSLCSTKGLLNRCNETCTHSNIQRCIKSK